MSRTAGVIGVPTSAGAFAPGQEQAPAALRAAGLLDRMTDEGLDVRDHGDRELWRWRPDRESPSAQHVDLVVEIVRDTASRVAGAAAAGELTLVLGGDCTVGIGTVAGHAEGGERLGLVYLDSHADLNVPASVLPGTLDWMGMAHMLGDEGAVAALAEAGPRTPLLDPDQVVLLGWNPDVAQEREREAIERLGLAAVPREEMQADPSAPPRVRSPTSRATPSGSSCTSTSTSWTSPTRRSPRTPAATRASPTTTSSGRCTCCSPRRGWRGSP